MPASIITPTLALAQNLPLDGAIAIELQDGIMIFRASHHIQERIENLLNKQQEILLTAIENQELDSYAEIDDYLSFVNRMIRNSFIVESPSPEVKNTPKSFLQTAKSLKLQGNPDWSTNIKQDFEHC